MKQVRNIVPISPSSLRKAASILQKGGLVAFPTETVYGLGADAFNPRAAEAVFRAKGRPADNPLIVHLASAEWLDQVSLNAPAEAYKLAKAFWPGPLTLVLKRNPRVPAQVSAGLSTVAVRVPSHPAALKLLNVFGRPIAAPSANTSGRPSPTRASHVADDLGSKLDLILDGGLCRWGLESTILDLSGKAPVILRHGAVSEEQIRRVLAGVRRLNPEAGKRVFSPGLRHRHYAPRCELRIFNLRHGEFPLENVGKETGVLYRGRQGRFSWARYKRAVPGSIENYARHLFAAMREAEAAGVEILYVEAVPAAGIGKAVMDRILRAAAGEKISSMETVLS